MTVFAWDDCPHDQVLCEGQCGSFVDTNNDEICDHSQPAPEDRVGGTVNFVAPEEEIVITDNGNQGIYHLIPISLFLVFLYVISHILSKKKIISIMNHRKIWNALLLTTFLASGILGILLVIRVNFGITTPLPFNILFWHVEIGIAMAVISIFHTLWHWSYFKKLFIIKK